ncbi:hypothetical protein JZ751_002651 [Albula glossodonta]|uniref:J domain-containing protein n=1 Tax=Albula glossodonta TaxID=121402 RepID=A0A8T2N8N2_9TELE|nr:hypothetical protein JZ751_002651 [Albula glossodonta]
METNLQKKRENKKSLRVKVISLGNAEVGKSCIIKRYCEKRFVAKYLATIGIDYGVTKVQVRDREIKVNIFDMAGHPFFYEVRNEFYKDSQGVILVYDVGLKESFDALDSWLSEMKQEMGSQANMESIIFVVCANKAFFSSITDMCENGGRRPVSEVNVGFTREQADTIRRIRASKDSWDMLGVKPGATSRGRELGTPLGRDPLLLRTEAADGASAPRPPGRSFSTIEMRLEEVNKAYRKLAVLLHPDKCVAPGSEDAFKAVVNARTSLLKNIK